MPGAVCTKMQDEPRFAQRLHELSGGQIALPLQRWQTVPCRQCYPSGYDRTAQVEFRLQQNLLSRRRKEKSESEESEPEQDVAESPDGWSGARPPVKMGSGYTARGHCDGQGFAVARMMGAAVQKVSRGRHTGVDLSYLHPHRQRPKLRSDCCRHRPSLAWKVHRSERSWSARSKGAVTNEVEGGGFPLNRTTEDREELAIDVRLLEAMLRASSGIGAFTVGVRVGPVQRCPGIRSCTPRRMQETAGTTGGRRRACCKGQWNHNYALAAPVGRQGSGTCCTNSGQLFRDGRAGVITPVPELRARKSWSKAERRRDSESAL